jgi:hypothetical protein
MWKHSLVVWFWDLSRLSGAALPFRSVTSSFPLGDLKGCCLQLRHRQQMVESQIKRCLSVPEAAGNTQQPCFCWSLDLPQQPGTPTRLLAHTCIYSGRSMPSLLYIINYYIWVYIRTKTKPYAAQCTSPLPLVLSRNKASLPATERTTYVQNRWSGRADWTAAGNRDGRTGATYGGGLAERRPAAKWARRCNKSDE